MFSTNFRQTATALIASVVMTFTCVVAVGVAAPGTTAATTTLTA